MRRTYLIVGLLFMSSGPAVSAAAQTPGAWAGADELFQQDARWAGGDGASSASIGDGILWFFADSFVRRASGRGRANSVMVRNSIAVQRGYDPARAELRFYWGEGPNGPTSYFPEENGTWFWPGSAVQLDSAVLLFLMQVREKTNSANEVFGFEVFDWQAVVIRNARRGPADWSEQRAKVAANPFQIIVGSAGSLQRGNYMYAFGAKEQGDSHPIYLADGR